MINQIYNYNCNKCKKYFKKLLIDTFTCNVMTMALFKKHFQSSLGVKNSAPRISFHVSSKWVFDCGNLPATQRKGQPIFKSIYEMHLFCICVLCLLHTEFIMCVFIQHSIFISLEKWSLSGSLCLKVTAIQLIFQSTIHHNMVLYVQL